MKTLAIRLDDELHAQLSVIAQLSETSITDEIRQAIESHLQTLRQQPAMSARAEAVLADIERDAAERKGAIAKLFGATPTPPTESHEDATPQEEDAGPAKATERRPARKRTG